MKKDFPEDDQSIWSKRRKLSSYQVESREPCNLSKVLFKFGSLKINRVRGNEVKKAIQNVTKLMFECMYTLSHMFRAP